MPPVGLTVATLPRFAFLLDLHFLFAAPFQQAGGLRVDFHEARQSGCAHAQETTDCTPCAIPDWRWGRQAAGEWRGQGEGGCLISRSCGSVMTGLSSGGASLLGRLQRTIEAAAKRGREGKHRGSSRVGGDNLSMWPLAEAWGGTQGAPRAEEPMQGVRVCQALWLTT